MVLTPETGPPNCDGCSKQFNVQLALTCKKIGLPTQRHNEIISVGGLRKFSAYRKMAPNLEHIF